MASATLFTTFRPFRMKIKIYGQHSEKSEKKN